MPVSCTCLVCHRAFTVKLNRRQKGGGKYCSRQCYFKRNGLPVICRCLTCQQMFTISPKNTSRGRGKYCSQQCYQSRRSLSDRFWSFVLKTDECWLWQGKITRRGYGKAWLGTREVLAHRLAYELTYGLILPGLLCCHHCDIPACVRPDHLFLGTNGDNLRDMHRKKRAVAYTHPERILRGEKHPRRLHPEKYQYPRGEQMPLAKLTESQVRAIRSIRATEQLSYVRLAARFDVSPTLIRMIIARAIWRHVP